MNTQETKKDNRTPVYHIGLVREGRKLIIQAKESVDDLSCEITDYLGRRQVSKATIEANKAILLAGFKALPKYRNCDMVEVQEQEAKYIPNKFEQIAYIERMQKALTKLNEALHHLDIVWQQDVDADMDMNDFLSDCYPFDPSFDDFTLEADVWYQKAWTALNRRKQVLMGFPVEKVYREGYMTNGVSNCVQSAYNVMKAKNDEVHEEDCEYLKKEVDSLAKETEARMREIRRLRGVLRELSDASYWLVIVWGDVDPQINGPYATPEDRDANAKNLRKNEGDENGIYKLTITNAKPEIEPYSGAFFDEEEDDEEGVEEPPAPYFTPEEAEGKWICAFDTIMGGWDCVRGSKGDNADVPYLYNSQEEVENDDFFDPDDDFAIPATKFIEGRRAIFTSQGIRIEGTPVVKGYKIEGGEVVKAEEPEIGYKSVTRVAKAWQSNDYWPTDIDIIELRLNIQDRAKLLEAMEKCRLYKYDYIAVRAGFGAKLLNHEGQESEMRTDVEYFKVFDGCVYFYAQSKYDSSTQIESERIVITQGLDIQLPDHAEYEVEQSNTPVK